MKRENEQRERKHTEDRKLAERKLEETIGYTFRDRNLFACALSHSSFANEAGLPKYESNERLEFLGDAVLELVTSEVLYRQLPTATEGLLTKERANAVCEPALAYCAEQIGLPAALRLGHGEEMNGGRSLDSVTSNALEALIGAIFLDGGIEPARAFILNHILADAEERRRFYDAKTILQEKVQTLGKKSPVYILISESGPDHHKEFRVSVSVDGHVLGEGTGRSKKLAEQNAAFEAIDRL